jgi:uncharacterized membrane protein YkoI
MIELRKHNEELQMKIEQQRQEILQVLLKMKKANERATKEQQ